MILLILIWVICSILGHLMTWDFCDGLPIGLFIIGTLIAPLYIFLIFIYWSEDKDLMLVRKRR